MSAPTRSPLPSGISTRLRGVLGRPLLRAWCAFAMFLVISANAWINAFGSTVAVCVGIASGVVSAIVWVRVRPIVNWRRLPWFPLIYVAWSAISLTWSAWPMTTAVTWAMLAATAGAGLFLAAMLTWRELVGTMASALKWVLALSIVFELYVSAIVKFPLLPGFGVARTPLDPFQYWSHNNLFQTDIVELRIQGIVGNANLLAAICVIAIIVFVVRLGGRTRHRLLELGWLALAIFLLVRAGSATAYVSLAVAALVFGAAMLMRTTRRPSERNRIYLVFAGAGALAVTMFLLMPNAVFALLGRKPDFTGREDIIWGHVLARAEQRPAFGWGFASPWLPWDPMFSTWIVDHDIPVMQAHNMWLDVFLQLGVVGLVIVAATYLAFLWRSWFFAVDRPRWDLRDDRPYSAISLIPVLIATVLLVQGLTESNPLLLWGWMFVVMLTFKIKQAPIVGHGPAEELDGALQPDARRSWARTVGF